MFSENEKITSASGYFTTSQTNPTSIGISAVETIPNSVAARHPMVIGTGLSGALGAVAVACHFGWPVGLIRKNREGSHAIVDVELPRVNIDHPWIIVDDFCASGSTLRRIKKEMNTITEKMEYRGEFLGTFLYRHNKWFTPEENKFIE